MNWGGKNFVDMTLVERQRVEREIEGKLEGLPPAAKRNDVQQSRARQLEQALTECRLVGKL